MPADSPLPYSRIAKFYTPLALSWIFMAIESPICVGIISRMDDPIVSLAAFPVLMGLAIWIESPVIDLLSTSTTLTRSPRDYWLIRRFALLLMAGVTVVHILVTMTPAFDLLTRRVMGIPPDVADAVRLGMAIMIPWSAAIGWRRYLQGILIRADRTRLIGFGTAIRVSTLALVGVGLFIANIVPSISVTGIALICSVSAEAVFIHLVSRDVVKHKFILPAGGSAEAPIIDVEPEPASAEFQPMASDPGPRRHRKAPFTLTMRSLSAFHFPLTLTTLVMLTGNPMVSAFLASTPESKIALASWGVAATLMWLMRTITYALPEVVIALHTGPVSARSLKRFCIGVGVGTSAIMLICGLTRLDVWFFREILKADETLLPLAHLAFVACSLLPFLGAVQSYVRGMLTAHHLTVSRLFAIVVGILALAASFAGLRNTTLTGVTAASLALTISMSMELAVLTWFWHRGKPTAA